MLNLTDEQLIEKAFLEALIVAFTEDEPCPECDGSGNCQGCRGEDTSEDCKDCRWTGECPECSGTGRYGLEEGTPC